MNRKQRRAVVKAGPATVVQPKALLDAALGQVAAGRPIQAEALFRKVLGPHYDLSSLWDRHTELEFGVRSAEKCLRTKWTSS